MHIYDSHLGFEISDSGSNDQYVDFASVYTKYKGSVIDDG